MQSCPGQKPAHFSMTFFSKFVFGKTKHQYRQLKKKRIFTFIMSSKMGEEGKSAGGKMGEEVTEDDLPAADLKVILLGDSAVGKSKLVERFLMGDYHPRQLSTYALTLFRYKADVDGKDVEVDFWDTAGQERFSSMHPSYYFGAHACILAFDVTRKVTYKNLNDWYKELRKYRENIPVILVANKIDVDYKVTQKKFAFGQKKGLPFEFVSAADGTNVVRVFKDAIRAGVEYKLGDKKDFMDDVMDLLGDDAVIQEDDDDEGL